MPLFLVAMLTVPLAETIETTKSLELKAQVVEAFELGPVIIDVSVTNRGNKALFLEEHRWPASYLITPNSWHPWYRQSRLFMPGSVLGLWKRFSREKPSRSGIPFLTLLPADIRLRPFGHRGRFERNVRAMPARFNTLPCRK